MNTTTLMMPVSECRKAKKKTLTKSNPGECLEEWSNLRNTKAQYSKQLRNFLKVSVPIC